MFRKYVDDDASDDDDYLHRKQLLEQEEKRKLTALSYDTAILKSKVVVGQPILQEKGRM